MAKQFKVDILSPKSISQLQKALEQYKKSLIVKTERLCKALSDVGIEVINAKIGESPLGKYISVETKAESIHNGFSMVLVATGEIKASGDYPPFNTLLAVEFGAGIHYNASENPKASELGFGVGTFPGQTHAFDENGWWFYDENKEQWIHSYGVKATMPMYSAVQEMCEKIEEIAREVFEDD
jgi:histone H3/H4